MAITVKIPVHLQHFTNNLDTAEVNGNTVGQCLDHLVKQFPDIEEALFDENGNLLEYVDIYINGESAYPEELAKPVKDGDELSIILIIGGG